MILDINIYNKYFIDKIFIKYSNIINNKIYFQLK